MKSNPERPIEWRAITLAGGPTPVWRELKKKNKGANYETVKRWAKGHQIAPWAVIPICNMCGGMFQPHQLRPDIFDESHKVKVVAEVEA